MKNLTRLQVLISFTLITLSGSLWAQTPAVTLQKKAVAERGVIGGGGGLEDKKGISIDSYIKRADEIKGFERVVKPVLEHIKKTLPFYFERLRKTIKYSGFYLTPHEVLNKLPASVQGIPFDITDFNHAAYNINNEAWFVEQLMEKKTEDDAGNLLLHEIFMLDIVSLIPKEKLAHTNPNYRQEWATVHSVVRRIGGYFRKYGDDSDEEVKSAVVNFYSGYLNWTVLSEMVKTQTELNKESAQAIKLKSEYDHVFNSYMPQFKIDAEPHCSKLPRMDQIIFMSNANFDEFSSQQAFPFAGFLYQRYIWLTKSGHFDQTPGGKKAVADIVGLTIGQYSDLRNAFDTNERFARSDRTRYYESILKVCVNLQNLPPVERR